MSWDSGLSSAILLIPVVFPVRNLPDEPYKKTVFRNTNIFQGNFQIQGELFLQGQESSLQRIITKQILIRRESTNEGKMYLEEKYQKIFKLNGLSFKDKQQL